MKRKKRSNLVLVQINTRTKENITKALEDLEVAEGVTIYDALEMIEALQTENKNLKAKLNEVVEALNSLSATVKTNAIATKLEISELKDN